MNTKIKTILSKLKSTFMEGAYRPLKFGALAAIGLFETLNIESFYFFLKNSNTAMRKLAIPVTVIKISAIDLYWSYVCNRATLRPMNKAQRKRSSLSTNVISFYGADGVPLNSNGFPNGRFSVGMNMSAPYTKWTLLQTRKIRWLKSPLKGNILTYNRFYQIKHNCQAKFA